MDGRKALSFARTCNLFSSASLNVSPDQRSNEKRSTDGWVGAGAAAGSVMTQQHSKQTHDATQQQSLPQTPLKNEQEIARTVSPWSVTLRCCCVHCIAPRFIFTGYTQNATVFHQRTGSFRSRLKKLCDFHVRIGDHLAVQHATASLRVLFFFFSFFFLTFFFQSTSTRHC